MDARAVARLRTARPSSASRRAKLALSQTWAIELDAPACARHDSPSAWMRAEAPRRPAAEAGGA
jgi:hypothetical protein